MITQLNLNQWQLCLGLAQERLGKAGLGIQINQSKRFFDIDFALAAQLDRLEVEILPRGENLIQLNFPLAGSLTKGNEKFDLSGSYMKLITSFQTEKRGDKFSVTANLNDPGLNFEVVSAQLVDDAKSVIAALANDWLQQEKGKISFVLFEYQTQVGERFGIQFRDVQITSTYAEYSPEQSGLLLLMRETLPQNPPENQLVLDPHILPNGENAVVWIAPDLLQKTGGSGWVAEAEQQLKMLPRAMDADIPNVTPHLQSWAESLINNVTLNEPLQFTSIQMFNVGLLLSATPFSVTELNRLTAIDLTKHPNNLVQVKAESLFSECMYYFMDDDYRENLLKKPKPILPQLLIDTAKPYADWLAHFARLQIAQGIKNSKTPNQSPFYNISKAKVEAQLKSLSSSSTFTELTNKLYALAFCLVRPRITLYMQDGTTWKQKYYDFLTSSEYSKSLLSQKNVPSVTHDATAKLNLFDMSGKTTKKAQQIIFNQFTAEVLKSKWQMVVKASDKDLEPTIVTALNETVKQADQTLESKNATPEQKQQAQEAKNAISTSGNINSLAAQIATALRNSASVAGYVPLNRAENSYENIWRNHPDAMNAGVGVCTAVASVAVIGLFIWQCVDAGKTKDLDSEQKDKLIFSLVSGAIASLYSLAVLIKLGSDALPTVMRCFGVGAQQVVSREIEMDDMSAEAATGSVEEVSNVAKFFKVAGGIVAVFSAALAIWNAVDDFKAGKTGAGAVDGLIALDAILSVAAIALSWLGPVAILIAAVGVILALVRIFFFSEENKAKDAADQLDNQLVADKVAVAS